MQVIELAGTYPLTDEAARDAACAAWDDVAETSRPIIDGLALPAFAGIDAALAERNPVGLIHHPASLETGLRAADRRRCAAEAPSRGSRISCHQRATGKRRRDSGRSLLDHRRRAGYRDARAARIGWSDLPIISVGTLVPRKGHEVLLRALARLFDLDWQLTIVGSADRDPCMRTRCGVGRGIGIARERAICRRADRRGPRDALAAGRPVRPGDALGRLRDGDRRSVEAGLPVAVSDGGAAGKLVTAESGVVCPNSDHINLSKALRR